MATYPVGMARTHLTLAALATAAVPGIDIVKTAAFSRNGDHDFDSALLTGRDGAHWIIRVPRSERAEQQQSADLLALRALSEGVRSRLPFVVSEYRGQAPVDGTRAIVYDFVYGSKLRLAELTAGPGGSAASVGRALAALHALPTSFVADSGLPMLTALDCLRSAVSVIDRAAATSLVPVPLLERWQRAADDATLWQFQPTVINNTLSPDTMLMSEGAVAGILGWHELRVGDPARDLAWLLGARGEDVAESAFDAYAAARPGDRHVKQRALLYAELEVAKWLLHGTDTRSTEIVDDAVDMLSGLLENVENDVMNPIGTSTGPSQQMSVEDVQEFLARAERAV
jgi:aminoglycoside phosphotransferase (APT) family kinase protein